MCFACSRSAGGRRLISPFSRFSGSGSSSTATQIATGTRRLPLRSSCAYSVGWSLPYFLRRLFSSFANSCSWSTRLPRSSNASSVGFPRVAVDRLHHLDVLAGCGLVEREALGCDAVHAQAHDALHAHVRAHLRVRVGDDERDLHSVRDPLAALRHELAHGERVRARLERLVRDERRGAAVAGKRHRSAKAVRERERTARGLRVERRGRTNGEPGLAEDDFVWLDARTRSSAAWCLLGLGARIARAKAC